MISNDYYNTFKAFSLGSSYNTGKIEHVYVFNDERDDLVIVSASKKDGSNYLFYITTKEFDKIAE